MRVDLPLDKKNYGKSGLGLRAALAPAAGLLLPNPRNHKGVLPQGASVTVDTLHHFLLCKVITFLAFVIQSKIQRNIISVISFNALGEHAKGENVFSACCEMVVMKQEYSVIVRWRDFIPFRFC